MEETKRYRQISVNDLLRSHFCVSCGVSEVKNEGERCEICATTMGAKSGQPLVGEVVVMGLKCKWEGCENRVNSHKGLAGWCGPEQAGHRAMEIDRRRKAGSSPTRGPLPLPRFGSDSSPASSSLVRNENGGWLSRVAEPVRRAVEEVEQAENDLAEAKMRLREQLEKALEAIS